ncbi:MAG: hypothetical protein ACI4V7_12445 [Succinivibrionaceae bacterium]
MPEFRKGAKIRCSDWIDGFYIQKDGETVIDHNNRTFHIHAEDTLSEKWELYKEPELDWSHIIKNKCLCWFWDDCEKYAKEYGFLGFLTYVQPGNNTDRFEDLEGKIWKNCRPVRRDEVTFYEDRKDVEKD